MCHPPRTPRRYLPIGRVAPGIAGLARIPVPGTILPNLPKGLVLTVQPPAGHQGSTSSIFIRNPDDARFGKPGLRLDDGPNKATGLIDHHGNVEGAHVRAT